MSREPADAVYEGAQVQSLPRLLITASGDLWAGAAVQIHQVAKALVARRRYVVRAALLNFGRLENELVELGIEVDVLDEKRCSNPALVRSLRRLISEFRPDIVHLNDYKLQVLVSLAHPFVRGRPALVRTFHSRPSRWPGLAGIRVAAFHGLDRFSLKHLTSRVIVVSADLAKEIGAVVSTDGIRIVPNGVARDPGPGPEWAEVRRRFGIPEDRVWIGTGIRLDEIKNPALLIEAAEILARSGTRFVLSIFGEGRLASGLATMIDEKRLAGTVLLHGHHDDLTQIMGAWDVFVLGSRHEGMPMALLEAMSRGVPPVCTRVGGIVEIVEDGVSGTLVPSGDAVALAAALERYCGDTGLREAAGRAAALRVKERFSVEAAADRYCEIYDELLSRRRGEVAR